MLGVGKLFIIVVTDELPVQPFALVTVTVNVPAVDTLIVLVVAPVDQR